MPVCKRDNLSRLQTLLVFLILNGMAKTKLAILSFLHCGEIVKNSVVIRHVVGIGPMVRGHLPDLTSGPPSLVLYLPRLACKVS